MRRKNSLDAVSHLFGQLKEMFSGASIRQVAGIRDVGEVFVGNVENATGQGADGPNMIHKTSRDVWTHVIDGLTGHSVLARLYAPAGALWRLPKKGDGAHVIRGRKMNGPGGPLAMVDGGDGSTDNIVPSWLGTSDAGISMAETVHVESTNGDVKVKAASGKKVYLGDDAGTEPAVLGNSLEQRLSDLEAKFLAHVHPVVFGACTAGGTTGTAPTSKTASTLPHSGDNIKASDVEVK